MKLLEDRSIPVHEDNDSDNESVTSFATRFFAHTKDEKEAAAAARSLTQAILTALNDLLEFTHETQLHPVLGEPNQVFLVCHHWSTQSGNYCIRMEARPCHFLLFYTSPFNIPTQKRVAVAEYICRVNYILLQGCLEMDMRDGEIQYKIVQRNSADMTAPVVVELLQTAVGTMDKFFPGVMAVTYTDKSPDEAFHDCERDDDDESEESTTDKVPTSLEQ